MTKYMQITERSEEEVKELVLRLVQCGDESAIPEIVESYIPLARKIAGHFISQYPHKSADITGAALHGLSKSVHRFPEVSYDEGIAAFIAQGIKGSIKTYLENDHTVRVPRSTWKRAQEKGVDLTVTTQSISATKSEYDPDNQIHGVDRVQAPDYEIPVNHYSEADYLHLYDELELHPRERQVIEYLMEGYSSKEISGMLDVTHQWISKILSSIRNKAEGIGLWCGKHESPVKRVCRECEVEKSLSDYNKAGHYEDAYMRICKECQKAQRKARKERNESGS